MHRRTFIGAAAAISSHRIMASLSTETVARSEQVLKQKTQGANETDEEFWADVRSHYVLPDDHVDFEQANIGRTATAVFDAYVERARYLSQAPADRFNGIWKNELDGKARPALAKLLGCETRELAFVDSATVGLNSILHGFPMSRGDEILVTDHEYPDMVETIANRCKRDGIVMRRVNISVAADNPEVLTRRIAEQISARTKLMLISHVSAWSGEVLPVQNITRMAQSRGVAVLVDAAQSIGVLEVSFKKIGCDFLAGSLHKWLGAPISVGALLMREEHASRVMPLHKPSWDTTEHPMDNFEWSGTFNIAARATVVDAINFYQRLGAQRKRNRLQHLGNYWMDKLAEEPSIKILTPRDSDRCFGMASFMLKGISSKDLAAHLRNDHRLLVQDKSGLHSPYDNAIRVAPPPYASTAELDRLIAAVRKVAKDGLPNARR